MSTIKYDLRIDQGAHFRQEILWREANSSPKDLTDYTARMQIRETYRSDDIIDELTTETEEITISVNTGSIILELDAERTELLPVDMTTGRPPRSRWVYDLELIDSEGKVKRLVYGDVVVTGEVTR